MKNGKYPGAPSRLEGATFISIRQIVPIVAHSSAKACISFCSSGGACRLNKPAVAITGLKPGDSFDIIVNQNSSTTGTNKEEYYLVADGDSPLRLHKSGDGLQVGCSSLVSGIAKLTGHQTPMRFRLGVPTTLPDGRRALPIITRTNLLMGGVKKD